jgi:hypothetical protein
MARITMSVRHVCRQHDRPAPANPSKIVNYCCPIARKIVYNSPLLRRTPRLETT